MAYLFIGMIIGGIIGLTVGSLAVAFRLAEKEITRLKREINSMRKAKQKQILSLQWAVFLQCSG